MTDAEINRAVVERTGYVHFSNSLCEEFYRRPDGRCFGVWELPNFATSLDAMAEAEATMTDGEWLAYINAIERSWLATPPLCTVSRYFLSVPARVRAIAFLKATEGRKP